LFPYSEHHTTEQEFAQSYVRCFSAENSFTDFSCNALTFVPRTSYRHPKTSSLMAEEVKDEKYA
jgi:hypothetical protein